MLLIEHYMGHRDGIGPHLGLSAALAGWRLLLGATNPFDARPGSIIIDTILATVVMAKVGMQQTMSYSSLYDYCIGLLANLIIIIGSVWIN